MASLRPMLGELELQQVQEIDLQGERHLAQHRVPALEGDFLQDLGRRGGRIELSGVVSGDGVPERLKELRASFRAARPVSFVSDIAAATAVEEVLIEQLELRELAGKPRRFEYRLALREFTEPAAVHEEDPPEIPPPELPEEATLVVEVIVEDEPGFDFARIRVAARGTTTDGQSLDRPLGDRQGNVFTGADFPPGDYTAEAAAEGDPALRGSAPAVVRPGETTSVTITLRRTPGVAEALVVHFRYDSAFVEPCARAALREIARRAADRPDEKLLLVGHTDLVGSPEYNQSLSERRARAVYAYLVFGRDAATAVAEWDQLRRARPAGTMPTLNDGWGTFQVQHMLQDVGFYVGNIDENESADYVQAIRDFQAASSIMPVTGLMDDATWLALIRRYLAVDPQSVAEEKFLPNRGPGGQDGVLKWLGCGEEDPLRSTQDAWRPNRRTEALFTTVAELPCRVPPPVTFALGAPEARNGVWHLGPGNPQERSCFLARKEAAPGKLLVRPAHPERVMVRGQIRFEDGTPVPFARFLLIAPDGEFLHTDPGGMPDLGEQPGTAPAAGQVQQSERTGRGRGIPDTADENGFFSYPKPTPAGHYTLEVLGLLRPQVARSDDQAPHQARGNVVCVDFAEGA